MNSKMKMIVGVLAVVLVGGGAAGGAMWWMKSQEKAPGSEKVAHAEPKKEKKSDKPVKYVTLDKVIVMLKRGPNEATTHYLSTDLVLATDEEGEKPTKDHLPLLRAVAVRSLSAYTVAEASAMSVEQYAAQLNKTFNASYASDDREKPFGEVMIGKLIVE